MVYYFLQSLLPPLRFGYRSYMDVTGGLKKDGVNFHQDFIRNLKWSVESSKIDILLEVSLISTHFVLPHEGNIE